MPALNFTNFAYGMRRGQDDAEARRQAAIEAEQQRAIRQQALDEARELGPLRRQQAEGQLADQEFGRKVRALELETAGLNLESAKKNREQQQFANEIHGNLQNFVGSGGDPAAIGRIFDLTAKRLGKEKTHTATRGLGEDGKNYIEVKDSDGATLRFTDNTPNPLIGPGSEQMSAQEQAMLFGEYVADPTKFTTLQNNLRVKKGEREQKFQDDWRKLLLRYSEERDKNERLDERARGSQRARVVAELIKDPLFSAMPKEEQKRRVNEVLEIAGLAPGGPTPRAKTGAPGEEIEVEVGGKKLKLRRDAKGRLITPEGDIFEERKAGAAAAPAGARAIPTGEAPARGAPPEPKLPELITEPTGAVTGRALTRRSPEEREALKLKAETTEAEARALKQKANAVSEFKRLVRRGAYTPAHASILKAAIDSGQLSGAELRLAQRMLDQIP